MPDAAAVAGGLSIKARLRHALPHWALDLAFSAGRLVQPGLSHRSSLKMCWVPDALPMIGTLPADYEIVSIGGEVAPAAWVETLKAAGLSVTPATWTEDYCGNQKLTVVLGIMHRGTIVGTAGVKTLSPDMPATGLLTWVGLRPEHQGRGLAGPLVAACLRGARDAGAESVFLVTDDHRLPAIKTYLSAGFRPCLTSWDWTHRPRWRQASRRLRANVTWCQDFAHTRAVARLP